MKWKCYKMGTHHELNLPQMKLVCELRLVPGSFIFFFALRSSVFLASFSNVNFDFDILYGKKIAIFIVKKLQNNRYLIIIAIFF